MNASHDLPPMGYERRCDANERLRAAAAQPLPTSQEAADALSRAFDAACDVLAMLNEELICPTPGSLEHVAYAVLMERVAPPGFLFAERLAHYLQHLPEPTEARRHTGVPCPDPADIPF